jgi:DUF1365 family protein
MKLKPAAHVVRGHVMHERLRPVRHRFVYPVFFLRLNLARLDEMTSCWFGIDCRRMVSIRTRDYGARDGTSLERWMRNVLRQYGVVAEGEILLQTFPRVFGFVFNPVSFWYCHEAGGQLRAVLAEVNNTFGETHRYLLHVGSDQTIERSTVLECVKRLHVSPFCEVRGSYRFRFRQLEHASFAAIDYHDDQGLLIKTAVAGHAVPMTTASLLGALMRQPFLTFGIVARIHWQALRLWLKRVPFVAKPAAPDQSISVQEETLS